MAFDLEAVIEAAVARGVRQALEQLKPSAEPVDFLTVAEAGSLAKVSPDTVRRWVKEGLLPAYGSPRRLRVRRDELLRVRPKSDVKRSPGAVVAHLLGPRGG